MPPLPLPLLLLLLLSHSPLLPSSASAWGRRGIVVGVRVVEEEGRVESFFKLNLDHENAARNCLEHLSLSSRCLSAISGDGDGMSVENRRAFTGAVLLYYYDCWSALRYVNGTHQVASAITFISNLTRLTSNALTMIAALQQFGRTTCRCGPHHRWNVMSTGLWASVVAMEVVTRSSRS